MSKNRKWIVGTVRVEQGAVITNRDSYLIQNLSVVSCRRPLLGPAMIISAALCLFGLSFSDLLYWGELAIILGAMTSLIILGLHLGQLKLLSRDLRQSELSDVIWGGHAELQAVRSEIVSALHAKNSAPSPYMSFDGGAS